MSTKNFESTLLVARFQAQALFQVPLGSKEETHHKQEGPEKVLCFVLSLCYPKATMENTSCILGDFIGGITLTGSLIAFGKLNGNLSRKLRYWTLM